MIHKSSTSLSVQYVKYVLLISSPYRHIDISESNSRCHDIYICLFVRVNHLRNVITINCNNIRDMIVFQYVIRDTYRATHADTYSFKCRCMNNKVKDCVRS